MSIFFGLIGRIITFATCISTIVSFGNIINLADEYSDEIEYVVEKSSNYDSLDAFFDAIMEEDVDTESVEADEESEEALEEEKKAEEEAEEEAAKKAEEEAKKKAEEEALKETEEEALKEAEEADKTDAADVKDDADDNTEQAEASAPAVSAPAASEPAASEVTTPAAEGRVEIGRVYMEDCGQDTGYWVVTYSDGSVEYIDD